MTSSTEPSSSPISIPEEAICLQCGYALRGLDPESECPECGLTIAESLKGNLLRFADAQYLDRLKLGTLLTLFGAAAMPGGAGFFVAAQVMVVRARTAAQPPATTTWLMVLVAALILITFVGIIALAAGLWLLSSADPAFTASDQRSRARPWVRVGMIGFCLGAAGLISAAVADATGASVSMVNYLLWPIGIASLVLLFLSFQAYLVWIARRLPDEQIMQRAHRQRWLIPVLCSVPVLLTVLAASMAGGAIFIFVWLICTAISFGMWWDNLGKVRGHLIRIHEARADS